MLKVETKSFLQQLRMNDERIVASDAVEQIYFNGAFFYICSRYDGDGMSDSYLNSGHIFKLDEEGLESSYY